MLPFAIPYPPEQTDGFWGKPTSTIDWCEENYVVSSYVAEALNTATNLGFIFLASMAILHAWQNRLESRFIVAAAGFLLVGVGSFLFHMTLKYEYQLLDELPMIYATCVPFWSVFSEFQPRKTQVAVGFGIFMAANLLTTVYLFLKNPTIHQTAYGLLNAGIIARLTYLAKQHVLDKTAATRLNNMMVLGVLLFLLGYALWNLDIHLCSGARALRRLWGMPYGYLLEGHGWWHLLTGFGVYHYLVYEEYLRIWLMGAQKFYECQGSLFPRVKLIDEAGFDKFLAEQSKAPAAVKSAKANKAG